MNAVDVLPLKVACSPYINYCYIISCQSVHEAVIVDPAWNLGKIEGTLAMLGACLKSVLITHSHPDHVQLAETMAVRHQCPVFMSYEEARYYRFGCRYLELLHSEEVFYSGAIGIEPLLTPGHTRGSICYRIGQNLFTGDTLFAEGCGMCFGPGSDPWALFDSLSKIKERISSDTRIFPGHSFGDPPGQFFSTILSKNIYLGLRREQFIEYRMRKNQKGLMAFR